MPSAWTSRFAGRTQGLTSSAIRELLKLTQRPEIISFAGGLPAAEFFPLKRFEEAARRVLHDQGKCALQYSTTEGYLPLREMVARHAARYGIKASPDMILITTGSQQALDLLGKLFIDEGAPVLVERPSYLGALQAFKLYGPDFISLPLDDEGVQVDNLRTMMERQPSFAYVLPNFHNPAGVTLSAERRATIVEEAARRAVPLVEDDPYGQLRYDGDHLQSLYALDLERAGVDGGNVIYLSSFSKVMAPGLRLGWVIAPLEVIHRLVQLKQGADLHSSTLDQMIAFEIAHEGFLDEHILRLRDGYRERRDAMLAALDHHFPEEADWTRPTGGLFLWLKLPPGINSERLVERALERGVAFVPGTAFYADGEDGLGCGRLNFSCSPPDQIEEGIRRLAAVLEEEMARLHETPPANLHPV
ncbi:MAG: PLP-dependent aminotransferase family protein [Anaerolineales bacterium]